MLKPATISNRFFEAQYGKILSPDNNNQIYLCQNKVYTNYHCLQIAKANRGRQ